MIGLREFSRGCRTTLVIFNLASNTGYIFSYPCRHLHVFPPLTPKALFLALVSSYQFSRAWRWLHVFMCLTMVVPFPALENGCTFSRAYHRKPVFSRLLQEACFPALVTGSMFPVLDSSYKFCCAYHRSIFFPLNTLCKKKRKFPPVSQQLHNFASSCHF